MVCEEQETPPLPVCRRRPLAASLADLGVEGVGVLVQVDVRVLVPGAVWPAVAAVHRAVQGVDAAVRVLLLGRPLRRAADVQDLGVVALSGLAFPQLPGLGLNPDGKYKPDRFTSEMSVFCDSKKKRKKRRISFFFLPHLELKCVLIGK